MLSSVRLAKKNCAMLLIFMCEKIQLQYVIIIFQILIRHFFSLRTKYPIVQLLIAMPFDRFWRRTESC
jgi:hypothetical protein